MRQVSGGHSCLYHEVVKLPLYLIFYHFSSKLHSVSASSHPHTHHYFFVLLLLVLLLILYFFSWTFNTIIYYFHSHFANVEGCLKQHTKKNPLEVQDPETYLAFLRAIPITCKNTAVVKLTAEAIKSYQAEVTHETTVPGLAAYHQCSTPMIKFKDLGIVKEISDCDRGSGEAARQSVTSALTALTRDQEITDLDILICSGNDATQEEHCETRASGLTLKKKTRSPASRQFSIVNGGRGYEVGDEVTSAATGLTFTIETLRAKSEYLCQFGCILCSRLSQEDTNTEKFSVVPMAAPKKREVKNLMRSKPLDLQRDGLLLILKYYFGAKIPDRWKDKCAAPGYCLVNMADRIITKDTQVKRDLIYDLIIAQLQTFIVDPIFKSLRPARNALRGQKEGKRTGLHSLCAGVGDRTIYLISKLWSIHTNEDFVMTVKQKALNTQNGPSTVHLNLFEIASRDQEFLNGAFKSHLTDPAALGDSSDGSSDESSEEEDDLIGAQFYDSDCDTELKTVQRQEGSTVWTEDAPSDDEGYHYTYVKKRVDENLSSND